MTTQLNKRKLKLKLELGEALALERKTSGRGVKVKNLDQVWLSKALKVDRCLYMTIT